MSVEDVPVVGQLAAAGGVVVDVLLNSGEVVSLLVTVAMSNVDLLLPIFTTLDKLADRIAWLPAGLVENIVTALLVTVFLLYVARLLGKLTEAKA